MSAPIGQHHNPSHITTTTTTTTTSSPTTTTTMPDPSQDMCTLLVFGAAYYYMFHLYPNISHYCHSKPRLQPIIATLNRLLIKPTLCRSATRLVPNELRQLAQDLLITDRHYDNRITGNWRFGPIHRFIIFLIWFTNYYPSRKLSILTGWASNSILDNMRYHVQHIIDILDVQGGGQCSSLQCQFAMHL